MRPIPSKILAAAFAIGAASALAMTSDDARAEVDFGGQTITIVVGFGGGGSYDAFGRLAADHFGAFLPGNPTVIVENMPGGTGRRSLVYMATVAPKDGTTITVPPANFVVDALRGQDAGVVDPTAFEMIGRLADARELQVTRADSETKTFADAQRRETLMASGSSSTVLRVLNAYFGAKFKPVQGFAGTAEMALAMERGEVEGMDTSVQTAALTHPDWLTGNAVNILWQLTADRGTDLPDVPALVEFAQTDEERALLGVLVAQSQIGKSLAAPPGVPEDVLTALREGYEKMVVDPAFLADAEKRRLELAPASAAEIQSVVADAMASDPEAVAKLVAVINAAAQ